MAQFHIRIAGHTAAVIPLFDSTREYCRNYLTEERAEFTVTVTRQAMESEQNKLDAEAREEGLRRRRFSDPFLERAVIQGEIARSLFERDILLMHGSTVAVDGEGYLFTAKCGTGKSTHTRLWRQVFGDRAAMVNDDKPFLEIREEGILAHGSPWSGKHGLDSNLSVPLKGICILERGMENRIERISPEEALPMLLHQGGGPPEPGKLEKYRELVNSLAERTALWRMECTKDPQAAVTAYTAMSGKHWQQEQR